jgi:hypothetical protein
MHTKQTYYIKNILKIFTKYIINIVGVFIIMEKETKKARFKRVAEKRVQNVINSIRNLAGLANKKIYEWEDGQLEKIWKAIDREITNCKNSFKDPDATVFRL